MPRNPNCDGGYCRTETGEVRVVPLSSGPQAGNLILCRGCFDRDIAWRRRRNMELAPDAAFDLPDWESLAIYNPES